MNNEERDNMLIEIHGTVKVIGSKVEDHDKTLYGNGNNGLSKDVTLLQERQNNCPARKATTVEGKRLTISNVMMAIAVVGIITTIILHITSK